MAAVIGSVANGPDGKVFASSRLRHSFWPLVTPTERCLTIRRRRVRAGRLGAPAGDGAVGAQPAGVEFARGAAALKVPSGSVMSLLRLPQHARRPSLCMPLDAAEPAETER